MNKYTGGIPTPSQTYNRSPKKKKRASAKTKKMRENIITEQIAAGKQRTLDQEQKCIVCDERKPKESFVRSCGEVSMSCRPCRTGVPD